MLTDPSDGLPCDEVGNWTLLKHSWLARYVEVSGKARKKYLGPGKAGATFVDLFCSFGKSRIKGKNKSIDGSAMVAWNKSESTNSPFSQILIADHFDDRRSTCGKRLAHAGAPVREIPGNAVEAAKQLIKMLHPGGLHLVFADPYSLAALDFQIIKTLSRLKRVDIIMLVSAMDFQRNLGANLIAGENESDFDFFCPGWRKRVDPRGSKSNIRAQILECWKQNITDLKMGLSPEMKLIEGPKGQRLYWLLLAAKNPLAHKFWDWASNPEKQGKLFG